jgi:hypothetical protein
MDLPFTALEFFDVFRQYNDSVWPMQLVLTGLGIAAVVLLALRKPGCERAVDVILTFLWGWMGLVYHLMFFLEINPAALYFSIVFFGAALVFLLNGVYGERLRYEIPLDARATVGTLLISYGLAVYPILSLWLGRWPEAPTFGLPCPTTIFTIGVLCFLRRPYPWYVLAVPVAWSFIGSLAVVQFGLWQDLGLLAAGLAGIWLLAKRKSGEHALAPAIPREAS